MITPPKAEPTVADRSGDGVELSIYEIGRLSPSFSWDERAAVTDADIDAALGAGVPGGSKVYAWLPMTDGHTIHQTARDVMRAAIAAVDKRRSTVAESASQPEVERLRKAGQALLPYTQHSIGCAIYQRSWAAGEPGCTCGLEAARAALTASEGERG